MFDIPPLALAIVLAPVIAAGGTGLLWYTDRITYRTLMIINAVVGIPCAAYHFSTGHSVTGILVLAILVSWPLTRLLDRHMNSRRDERDSYLF